MDERNAAQLKAVLEALNTGAASKDEVGQALAMLAQLIKQTKDVLDKKISDGDMSTSSEVQDALLSIKENELRAQRLVNEAKQTVSKDFSSRLSAEISRVESLIPELPEEQDLSSIEQRISALESEETETVDIAPIEKRVTELEGKIPDPQRINDIERIAKANAEASAMPVTTTHFLKNGTPIGRAKNINFLEGNNTTLNVYQTGDQINVSIASTGGSSSINFADEETPTDSGDHLSFTLAHTPTAGSLKVTRGGARQQAGAGNDYTLSGSTITLSTALQTGEILLADYRY